MIKLTEVLDYNTFKPDYMRGYSCKKCNKEPEIIVKQPMVHTYDKLAMHGAIAIRCRCFGAHLKMTESKMRSDQAVVNVLKRVWISYRAGVKDLFDLAGPVPEGQDPEKYYNKVAAFLKD